MYTIYQRPSPNTVEKCGYLDIKYPSSIRGRKRRVWLRRWVVIRKFVDMSVTEVAIKLDSYPDEDAWRMGKKSDKTSELLENITRIERTTSSRTHPFAFCLSADVPRLFLSGRNETESQEWMQVLREIVMPRTVEPPSPDTVEVTVIDNEESIRHGLNGTYYIHVSPKQIRLIPVDRTRKGCQWRLRILSRFCLSSKDDADVGKVLTITVGPCNDCPESIFHFFCPRARELLTTIYSNIQMALEIRSQYSTVTDNVSYRSRASSDSPCGSEIPSKAGTPNRATFTAGVPPDELTKRMKGIQTDRRNAYQRLQFAMSGRQMSIMDNTAAWDLYHHIGDSLEEADDEEEGRERGDFGNDTQVDYEGYDNTPNKTISTLGRTETNEPVSGYVTVTPTRPPSQTLFAMRQISSQSERTPSSDSSCSKSSSRDSGTVSPTCNRITGLAHDASEREPETRTSHRGSLDSACAPYSPADSDKSPVFDGYMEQARKGCVESDDYDSIITEVLPDETQDPIFESHPTFSSTFESHSSYTSRTLSSKGIVEDDPLSGTIIEEEEESPYEELSTLRKNLCKHFGVDEDTLATYLAQRGREEGRYTEGYAPNESKQERMKRAKSKNQKRMEGKEAISDLSNEMKEREIKNFLKWSKGDQMDDENIYEEVGRFLGRKDIRKFLGSDDVPIGEGPSLNRVSNNPPEPPARRPSNITLSKSRYPFSDERPSPTNRGKLKKGFSQRFKHMFSKSKAEDTRRPSNAEENAQKEANETLQNLNAWPSVIDRADNALYGDAPPVPKPRAASANVPESNPNERVRKRSRTHPETGGGRNHSLEVKDDEEAEPDYDVPGNNQLVEPSNSLALTAHYDHVRDLLTGSSVESVGGLEILAPTKQHVDELTPVEFKVTSGTKNTTRFFFLDRSDPVSIRNDDVTGMGIGTTSSFQRGRIRSEPNFKEKNVNVFREANSLPESLSNWDPTISDEWVIGCGECTANDDEDEDQLVSWTDNPLFLISDDNPDMLNDDSQKSSSGGISLGCCERTSYSPTKTGSFSNDSEMNISTSWIEKTPMISIRDDEASESDYIEMRPRTESAYVMMSFPCTHRGMAVHSEA